MPCRRDRLLIQHDTTRRLARCWQIARLLVLRYYAMSYSSSRVGYSLLSLSSLHHAGTGCLERRNPPRLRSIARPLSSHPQDSHIELGYSIILTIAPKLFGGRLFLNRARTTPELPVIVSVDLFNQQLIHHQAASQCRRDCTYHVFSAPCPK